MATRSFVYSALVIMLVMIIVASALTIAFAEEAYMVQGTITGFELTEKVFQKSRRRCELCLPFRFLPTKV